MTLIHRTILALTLMTGITPAIAAAPAPVPALPDTERRTTYGPLNPGICACAVNFALYGDGTDYQNWVEVFVNGALVPAAGNWTITSPSGPIANLPRPITDAILTFNPPVTGIVQIVGARRPRQTQQFSEGGVTARALNQRLTDITAILRETWDKTNDVTGRAVMAPPGETLALLPVLASRANMGACFDSNGYLTSCIAAAGSTIAGGNGILFTGTNPTTISNNIAAGANVTITGTNPLTISAPTSGITYTNPGTGGVPVTLSSMFSATVTPEQFGAQCNGTGDDGPAINRAINSTADFIRVVFRGDCTYRVVTPVAWTKHGVSLEGAPIMRTRINFAPASDNQALFTGANGATQVFFSSIRNFWLYSTNVTFSKTLIKLSDISETLVENIHCSASATDNSPLSGGGTGSICLKTNGRDTSLFRNLLLSADKPIFLGKNPNTSSAVSEDADHFRFSDLYLFSGTGNPLITLQNGAVPSQLTFDGEQVWIGGAYGFFAQDTISTANWTNVSFSNVRSEQSNGGGVGFTFYISVNPGANRLVNLTIRNTLLDSANSGILLRGVQGATLENIQGPCGVAPNNVLIMDASNDSIQLINNRWESSCLMSIAGLTVQHPVFNAGSATIPSSAFYSTVGTAGVTCSGAPSGSFATINGVVTHC